jgi:hypothetical protein
MNDAGAAQQALGFDGVAQRQDRWRQLSWPVSDNYLGR